MSDILCSNVPVIEVGRPKASSVAYALATVIGYTHPYEFSDLAELAQTIQSDYEGNAPVDTPLTKEQITDALNKYGVKFIDEQSLLDKAKSSGDYSDTRHELGSQNRQSVIQLIVLSSGNKLALAIDNPNTANDSSAPLSIDGSALHGWLSDAPYGIVRVGMSTDKPTGRYIDVLTNAIDSPLAITWENVSKVSGIEAIFAIPNGSVEELPPSDFRYFGGLDASGNPIDNTWPLPHPAANLDVDSLGQNISNIKSHSDDAYVANVTSTNDLVTTLSDGLSKLNDALQIASALKDKTNAAKQNNDEALIAVLRQINPNLVVADGSTASAPTQPTSISDTPAQPVAPTPPSSASDEPTQPTSTDVVPATPTSVTMQQLPETQGLL